jgi:hypothetical protein
MKEGDLATGLSIDCRAACFFPQGTGNASQGKTVLFRDASRGFGQDVVDVEGGLLAGLG